MLKAQLAELANFRIPQVAISHRFFPHSTYRRTWYPFADYLKIYEANQAQLKTFAQN